MPLGIGRLVFRALAVAELVLAVALTTALALSGAGPGGAVAVGAATWTLMALLWAVARQTGWLRPRLDRRADRVPRGGNPPRPRVHLVYVALEMVKLVLLLLGIVIAA